MHLPYVHKAALKEATARAKSFKPDTFIQIGDMFDCHSVTRHARNPSKARAFVDEIAESWSIMKGPMRVLNATVKRFHFTEGNHELWLRKLVWRASPELDGLLPSDPFRLKENGFLVTPYRHMLKIGKVWFNHDVGGAGIQAARKALSAVQGNIVQGHTHRAEIVYETNAKGVSHFGCVAGWLGDPSEVIDYMSPTVAAKNWSHACVEILMDSDGNADAKLCPLF